MTEHLDRPFPLWKPAGILLTLTLTQELLIQFSVYCFELESSSEAEKENIYLTKDFVCLG